MCGRYATTVDSGRLAAELDAIDETDVPELAAAGADAVGVANYNVAPTDEVLTVVERRDRDHPDDDPRLRLRRMRWGLVPSWTKPGEPGLPAKGKPLFNARAEKAATTASFRDAVKKRRCLVPMDGWYEWLTEPAGRGRPSSSRTTCPTPTAAPCSWPDCGRCGVIPRRRNCRRCCPARS